MGDMWYTSPPPKDREIIVEVTRQVYAYWDEQLKTYVFSRGPLHLEDEAVPRRWREREQPHE